MLQFNRTCVHHNQRAQRSLHSPVSTQLKGGHVDVGRDHHQKPSPSVFLTMDTSLFITVRRKELYAVLNQASGIIMAAQMTTADLTKFLESLY